MPQPVRTRRKPGEVRDAIISFLRSKGADASVAEIRQAVAEKFKGEFATSSVRSYLRLNTPGEFESPGEGVYRLAATEAEPPASPARPAPIEPAVALGKSRLFLADCLEWMSAQASNSIHAVVTDPPYGLVEYSEGEQEKLCRGKGGVWRIPPSFDGHKRSPLPRFTVLRDRDLMNLGVFFVKWARACMRILVPGAHVAVATNPLLSYRVSHALSQAGFERRGEIVRLVMTMRGGDRPKNAHREFSQVSVMPRSMWEPWLLFRKPMEGRVQDNLRKWATGGLRRPSPDKPFGDVIESSPTRPLERRLAPHPSLKPQAFLRKVVHAILPLGEGIVLDPFAGSGSTLAAAEAVGYQSIGVEKDQRYVRLASTAIAALAQLKVNGEPACKPNSDGNGLFPHVPE